jgi:protein SCO1/2
MGEGEHETADIDARRVMLAGGMIVVAILVAVAVGWGIIEMSGGTQAAVHGPPRTLRPQPEARPLVDIAAYRAGEQRKLTTYEWIDRGAGVVRIPVERAMEILAARSQPKAAGLSQPKAAAVPAATAPAGPSPADTERAATAKPATAKPATAKPAGAKPAAAKPAAAKVGASSTAQATPRAVRQRVGLDPHLGARIPLGATLRDERGNVVRLGEFFGSKPAILALVYYQCPNLCNFTLTSLVASLKPLDLRAGKDFEVIAISIDPREHAAQAAARRDALIASYASARDTPARDGLMRDGLMRDGLTRAALARGTPVRDSPTANAPPCRNCDSGWHLLTGDAKPIAAIAQAVGFRYFWDAAQSQFAHPAGITIITPQGRIARYFGGVEFPSPELRHALLQAQQQQIVSTADRLWLLCYHYEALIGKYSAVIMTSIRFAAIGVVLALAILIVRLARSRP